MSPWNFTTEVIQLALCIQEPLGTRGCIWQWLMLIPDWRKARPHRTIHHRTNTNGITANRTSFLKPPTKPSLLFVISFQQTQNICITFVQCWTNVFDWASFIPMLLTLARSTFKVHISTCRLLHANAESLKCGLFHYNPLYWGSGRLGLPDRVHIGRCLCQPDKQSGKSLCDVSNAVNIFLMCPTCTCRPLHEVLILRSAHNI